MKQDRSLTSRSEESYRTIGEVADELDLPAHVLRFWETRFRQIDPIKRAGGRRYYRPHDVALVRAIRHLLYGEGYTIKGVQRLLKERGPRAVIESALGRVPQAPESGDDDGDGGPHLETSPLDASHTAPLPAMGETSGPEAADRISTQQSLLPALVGPPARAERGLDDDDIRRLRLALADLHECRRLLSLTRE